MGDGRQRRTEGWCHPCPPHTEIMYFQSTLKTTGIFRDRPCSIHRSDSRNIVADGTSKHTFRASGRRQGTYGSTAKSEYVRDASEFDEIDVEKNQRNKSEERNTSDERNRARRARTGVFGNVRKRRQRLKTKKDDRKEYRCARVYAYVQIAEVVWTD